MIYTKNTILSSSAPQYNQKLYSDIPTSTSWTDTLAATLQYNYQPMINAYYNRQTYNDTEQGDYIPMENIPDEYMEFRDDLIHAKNQDHMNDLIAQIDGMREVRSKLANASLFNQFTAGLFDPINLVALPFGGPTYGIVRSGLRVGTGVAALQAGLEVPRQMFDPVTTMGESAMNVGGAFIVGNALGGLMAVPITQRINAMTRTAQENEAFFNATRQVNAEHMEFLGQRGSRIFQPLGIPMDRLNDEQIANLLDARQLDGETLENITGAVDPQFAYNRQQFNDLSAQQQSELLDGIATEARSEQAIRQLETTAGLERTRNDLVKNWFTDSFAWRFITTPLKRTLQSKFSAETKEAMLNLIGDGGHFLVGMKYGQGGRQSIHTKAATYQGEWLQVHKENLKIWGDFTGQGVPLETKMDWHFGKKRYDQWLEDTWKKSQTDPENLTQYEQRLVDTWNRFFKKWEQRLRKSGELPDKLSLQDEVRKLDADYRTYNGKLRRMMNQAGYDPRSEKVVTLKKLVYKIKQNRKQARINLDSIERGFLPNRMMRDSFFPRIWNVEYVKQNREALAEKLRIHFRNNPESVVYDPDEMVYTTTRLSTRDSDIEARVQNAIDAIVNESDPLGQNILSYGSGVSSHLKHRQLDIPNGDVADFIMTNPIQVMQTYTRRTAAKHEFFETFGYHDPEIVIGKIIDKELDAGRSIKEVNRLRRDFLASYDRVAATAIQNPDTLSMKVANTLKDLATLNYLGSAGFAALPDAAVTIMQSEMGPLFRQLFSVLNDNRVRMNAMEAQQAGEGLETILADVHMRIVAEETANPFANSNFERLRRKGRHVFFQLNLLGPFTRTFKQFSSMANSHNIIEYSTKWADGSITQKQRDFLVRHGIGEREAKLIDSQREENIKIVDRVAYEDAKFLTTSRIHRELNEAINTLPESRSDVQELLVNDLSARDRELITNLEPDDLRFEDFVSRKFPRQLDLSQRDGSIFSQAELQNFIQRSQEADFDPVAEGLRVPSDQEIKRYKNAYSLDGSPRFMEEGAGMQKSEKGFWYANSSTWTNDEALMVFRRALNMSVSNNVLMGTPADKPLATDGVFYIPMRIARMAGMKEDPRVSGYARIEQPLMALPFQFYSYAFAAANKITGLYAQGAVTNRLTGVVTMMGLAYMGMQLKYMNNPYVLENMSLEDKIARSFDMSGLAAIYSDIFYTSLHTSLALGGPDIGMGVISPKYRQEKDYIDAVTMPMGAGVGIGTDLVRSAGSFVMGDYGEGSKDFISNLPYMRLWFLKDLVNDMTRSISDGLGANRYGG